MMVLSVLKIIRLMINYTGLIYLVSVDGVDYAVKIHHLEEFVSLMHDSGVIIVNHLSMSQTSFDHDFQWYKKL